MIWSKIKKIMAPKPYTHHLYLCGEQVGKLVSEKKHSIEYVIRAIGKSNPDSGTLLFLLPKHQPVFFPDCLLVCFVQHFEMRIVK